MVENAARVPVGVDGADDEAVRARAAPPGRRTVAALAAVPGGRDEQHALLRRVLTAARSVGEVCEPPRLRLTMRAPWSTAQTMPAASSTSEKRRAAVRLHDHQLRLAAEAESVPSGERRDEGAVTDRVVDAGRAVVTL